MNRIAIDLGKKHTGICLYLEGICIPKDTINTEYLQERLISLIEEYDIYEIIVGLPLNMQLEETDMSVWVKGFVKEQKYLSAYKIIFVSEILTSVEAENIMREHYSIHERKGNKDAVSACLIMENYINEQKK